MNGGIKLAEQAEVGGDVENVNGAITLRGARIGGDVTTTNGDIVLSGGARIDGGILVEKPTGGWWKSEDKRVPRIVIGANSVVAGSLVFEHAVELFVHPTAKTGPITGATAQSFTDALPPRD